LPILISLEQSIEGNYANNLAKVIIEALKRHGNVSNAYITTKLISSRANGVNVFQRVHNAISCQIKKTNCSSFGKHPLHGTLHDLTIQTLFQLPMMRHIKDLLLCLFSLFFHSLKWHLEFLKLVDLMNPKGKNILQNVKTWA
jgi:hypothetical protein